ncbi:2-keto-3-deoxy-L-rhamnonate aldolase [Senna tora]|uniref:2-keto-3-deoxy-L-rhamnonate aldolase n=1 Tax=Senna tora TaxID=362788 RepID=A0A834W3Z3_9FABA|nr:2-keto-3-deoxy-L-rhamnonate aldolase [Senna tora]
MRHRKPSKVGPTTAINIASLALQHLLLSFPQGFLHFLVPRVPQVAHAGTEIQRPHLNAVNPINGCDLISLLHAFHRFNLTHYQQLVHVTTQIPFIKPIPGSPHNRVGRPADSRGWESAIRHRLLGGFRALNHGEHNPLWTQIESLLGPGGASIGDPEDRGGSGGGEGVEAGKRVGDAAVAVLHIDDDEVKAGETGDLGEGGGEGEHEEAIEGFAILEAGFEVHAVSVSWLNFCYGYSMNLESRGSELSTFKVSTTRSTSCGSQSIIGPTMSSVSGTRDSWSGRLFHVSRLLRQHHHHPPHARPQLKETSHAKVCNLGDPLIIKQDVAGLDVSVDDAVVSEFEGFHEIVKKAVRFGHGDSLWFPKPTHERVNRGILLASRVVNTEYPWEFGLPGKMRIAAANLKIGYEEEDFW